MKKEVRNIRISLLLAAVWLFQFSLHAYHIFSEHTDSQTSFSETFPIIKKLDDGSLSCHLCVLLNNHFPLYTQEIAVVAIIFLMILLPIHHLKGDFFLLLPEEVQLRGPPSFK